MNSAQKSNLIKFWGKASEKSIPIQYHPVIYHSIDTAMVAGELWDRYMSSAIKTKLSKQCDLTDPELKIWMMFFAGCHDVGKITPGFQGLIPELTPIVEQTGLHVTSEYRVYHNTLSAHILWQNDSLPIFSSLNPKLREGVAFALGGHHGEYPSANELQKISSEVGGTDWGAYQAECVRTLGELCKLNDRIPIIKGQMDTFFVILSGITSVSDWIASNNSFFPYSKIEENVAVYFAESQKRAFDAVNSLSLGLKNMGNDPVSFGSLFPKLKDNPFPMQVAAEEMLPKITEPSLIIVEAPMGEGKTETAFLFEAHQSYRIGNQGSYIALPTQATANQMFGRFKEFLGSQDFGASINLHLIHGNAVLSEKYQSMIVEGSARRESNNQLIANSWFTYKKRGLISTFGVGTIDQALLSVLPTRHFFVRLFGLAGKTVIFDEVHAYDTYMSTLLEELITWLGALGSSVILLSATLPQNKSKSLMEKYSGRDFSLTLPKYPRISWVSENSGGSVSFESASLRAGRVQSVDLKWIARSEIIGRLAPCIKSGGHVACIFNTVKEAQNFYLEAENHFKGTGIKVNLLHSKFIFDIRNQKEIDCISLYGLHNEGKRDKTTSIFVSTQIIEQSLDLDFDLIITDFAPGDLILQRMGRLHRHSNNTRPKNLEEPELWLINPELNSNGILDFGKSEYIYSRYVLLKTISAMKGLEHIRIPEDIPRLVEAIYNTPDDCTEQNLAEQLKDAKTDYEEEMASLKNEAMKRSIFTPDTGDPLWLKLSDYQNDDDDPRLNEQFKALTRLTEPSLPAVCLYRKGSVLYLDREEVYPVDMNTIPNENLTRKLLGRSIAISNKAIIREMIKTDVPDAWKKNALLKNHRILELSPSDDSSAIGKHKISIDDTLGMRTGEIL